MKSAVCVVICFVTLMTTLFWVKLDNGAELYRPPRLKRQPLKPSQFCKCCQMQIQKTMELYSQTWRRQQWYYQEFRSLMRNHSIGVEDAIINKADFPVQSHIAQKPVVTKSFFSLLPPANPFFNKTWDTCAVVGNGGILFDSHCGKNIDSADFVIRCNLPPLHGDFSTHVGTKTSFVTSNPSILKKIPRNNYSQEIMERMKPYGDAMIAFPSSNRLVLKSVETLQQLKSPSRPVLLNPKYMSNLTAFWRSRGVKARLSSGLIMVSMALQVCKTIHVYGFWPFSVHPVGLYFLPHHYYDDTLPKRFHKMSVEFTRLLELHTQGVIRLQLGACGK